MAKFRADHYLIAEFEKPDIRKEGKNVLQALKEVPELKGDISEIEFKDVVWKNDEQIVVEIDALNGTLQNTINKLKYIIEEDRSESINRERAAELLDILAGIRDKDYQSAEEAIEEPNPLKEPSPSEEDSKKSIMEKLNNALEKINAIVNFEDNLSS